MTLSILFKYLGNECADRMQAQTCPSVAVVMELHRNQGKGMCDFLGIISFLGMWVLHHFLGMGPWEVS